MDSHDEHLLVVRAVEDPDLAALRQPPRVAPQEVMVELLGRRDLEAVHRDSLRVDTAHHVPDRPVLARRIEGLKYDEHAPRILSGEPLLILRQQAHALFEQREPVLLLLDTRLEARVEVLGQLDLRPGLDAERSDELLEPLSTPACQRRHWRLASLVG